MDTFVGSANLTASALGWAANSNLELLVHVDGEAVESLEERLVLESVAATQDIARRVEEIAALLPRCPAEGPSLITRAEILEEWFPRLRIPADLFLAYRDGVDTLASTSAAAAGVDLLVLDLPPGLARQQFEALVSDRLLGQAFFKRLDHFLTRQRRFGEVRDMIMQALSYDRDEAETIWQTAMRWMFEFLPERYSYTVHRRTELVCLAATGVR